MPLPKKSYFTIEEVLERWKKHDPAMSRVTLLDYASQDLLVFSVYLRDIGSHKTQEAIPGGFRTIETTSIKFVSDDAVPVSRLQYLAADDARRILEARPGEKIAVQVLFSNSGRDPKTSGCLHGTPKHFTAEDLLVSWEELERFEVAHGITSGAQTVPDTTLGLLLDLCQRFPRVVKVHQARHGSRSKMFDMSDEYDMQDLMHGLLVATFDDVRAEDFVPSRAGRNSRIDFLICDEQIGLELKMARESMSAKDLYDQLVLDIHRYPASPNCKKLVFLVYDPLRTITNTQGLINDLSGPHRGVDVTVLVVT